MKKLPPLNALRAFDAAVRSGSFTRAGESQHVTQGAISRQIKQLEDWLGKPVFLRHYQGLILTPAGSLLAQSLDAAFGTIQDAVEQIGHLSARQRISVNVPETFASRWLAPRLRTFHNRHPDIDLTITTNAVATQRDAQQYDCLVLFLDQPWAKGHCRLLRQEQYVGVASPELWQDGIAPALETATLLHVLAGSKRLPLWENWFASLGIRHIDARPGIAFSTMDQAINAAVSGAGVAVVDAPMVARELSDNRLRRLDTHELTAGHGYWFVEPRERALCEPAHEKTPGRSQVFLHPLGGPGEARAGGAHSAVVALFQAWLLELSHAPATAA